MEPTAAIVAIGIVGLLILPFVLAVFLARPLVMSLADLISGKRTGQAEIKDMKIKIQHLELEVNELRAKFNTLEDSHEFSLKLLEDIQKPSPDRPAIGKDAPETPKSP